MGSLATVPPTLDAALLREWASAATEALQRYCAEIDRINVFPVPDGDTGTNLLLTMRAAVDASGPGHCAANGAAGVGAAAGVGGPDGVEGAAGPVAAALARGALRGARGNSGVILSQVLRGLADAIEAADGPCDGAVLADALRRAHRLATAALSHPREGTVLTVLRAAAAAAAARVATGEGCLAAVAASASLRAAIALHETTAQLPELARAGAVSYTHLTLPTN